jgi:Mrp family chromosome partitioning ATPase
MAGQLPEKKFLPGVKRVLGVMSGKGGVGKSTVAVLLAEALAARGRKVGVLDADITGPSLPRLLGVDSFRGGSDGEKLLPVESEEGIKVLSINLFHDDEDNPVVWRGPLLAGALSQFYGDTEWGELDFLIVDFPPGTSDVAITAFQTIPFSGVVVVGTPQDYVSMIVAKSVRLAGMLDAPVLGVVENMRSMVCPDCGKTVELFADGKVDSVKRFGLPLLASLPWRKEIVRARSLRWAELPEAARKEADAMATEVELALASRPAPAPKASACDAGGGCECGTSSCCSSCSSNPDGPGGWKG